MTSSTANIADSSTTITIDGTGFSTTTASDSVASFNDGAVGTRVERNDNQPDGGLLNRSHHGRHPNGYCDDELGQQRGRQSRSPR